MSKEEFNQLSNDELLAKKKELKKTKTFNSFAIGFLIGIFTFGMYSLYLAEEKNWIILIPMLIPVFFVYKLVKASGKHKVMEDNLKEVLKERNLI